MERKPTVKHLTRHPEDHEGVNGDVVHVIDEHDIYWGSFKRCSNWCREEFWLPCDRYGRLY